MPSRSRDDAGIVVPLRSFTLGKARLAAVLVRIRARGPRAHDGGVRRRAPRGDRPVVDRLERAPRSSPGPATAVSTSSTTPVRSTPRPRAGRAWASDRGLARVTRSCTPICRWHDRSTRSSPTAPTPVAVIVPDHRDDGTPVLSLPDRDAVHVRVRTRFGRPPRRRGPARRSLTVRIVRDPTLGLRRRRRRRPRRARRAPARRHRTARRRMTVTVDLPVRRRASSRSAPTPTTSSSAAARRSRSGRRPGRT